MYQVIILVDGRTIRCQGANTLKQASRNSNQWRKALNKRAVEFSIVINRWY